MSSGSEGFTWVLFFHKEGTCQVSLREIPPSFLSQTLRWVSSPVPPVPHLLSLELRPTPPCNWLSLGNFKYRPSHTTASISHDPPFLCYSLLQLGTRALTRTKHTGRCLAGPFQAKWNPGTHHGCTLLPEGMLLDHHRSWTRRQGAMA